MPLRFTADSSSLNHHPVIEIRGVGEWAELYRDTEGIFTGSASSEVVGRSSMTAVEIYAGAGGMSLGLRQAGFRMLAAYDSSPAAVAVYNRNVGYHATQADLTDVALFAPRIAALRPDIIVGGPPCQDFSPAGLRTEGERANHTRIFALYVCAASPEWFVMENVQRARNSAAWLDGKEMLSRAGYGMTEIVVDAAYYGVPQRRKRLLVIGRRGERDGFMDSSIRKAAAARPMSLRELFGDGLGDHVYNHPRSPGRRGVWSADEPNPTIRNARRPQPSTYVPHPGDSNYVEAVFMRPYFDGRGVFSLDEAAPAIVRTSRERPRQSYLDNPHPADPAPAANATVLTQSDTSRIQGFPRNWDWSGCRSRDVDQMIANAVPAPMARIIGTEILRRHHGQTWPEVPGNFGQWLAKSRKLAPQLVANVKWRVRKAHELLGGRAIACAGTEARRLEEALDLQAFSAGKKSDIRRALRLYREWHALRA
ncbi:MAG: DNA cytosine methyltransferase [Rhizobiaceae bacterium]|nr:DNA cytosine methyltransferase [Rhizobiaceae bacterium]